MNIQTTASRQMNAALTEGGEQRAAFFAAWKANSLTLNVDVFDAEWARLHQQEIGQAFDGFWREVLGQAAEAGLPVSVP